MDDEHGKVQSKEEGKKIEDDYDLYIVKLDRHDKEGNDISGDLPSSGGRRKGGSKLSTQYYDPVPYKPDQPKEEVSPSKSLLKPDSGSVAQPSNGDKPIPKPRSNVANQQAEARKRQAPSTSSQMQKRAATQPKRNERSVPRRPQPTYPGYPRRYSIKDRLVDEGINMVARIAADVTGELTDRYVIPKVRQIRDEKVIPFFRNLFWGDDTQSKQKQSNENVRQAVPREPATARTPASNSMVTTLQKAVYDYRRDMSNEEKQRHLLRMYLYYIGFVKEWKALEGVPITEQDIAEVKRILWSPQMTEAVNTMLTGNSMLLEDAEIKSLSGIFETSFVQDGEFVPIRPSQVHDLIEGFEE